MAGQQSRVKIRRSVKMPILWECLLIGIGTLAFNQCNAGSSPVTPTEKTMKEFTLKIVNDELMWVKEDTLGRITAPLEVFRPNEYEARKLYKQLQELFDNE